MSIAEQTALAIECLDRIEHTGRVHLTATEWRIIHSAVEIYTRLKEVNKTLDAREKMITEWEGERN